MPKGQPKDKRLVALKREVAEFEKYVQKASPDPKEKAFREQQLASAKAALAKYLQDKPKE